MDTEYTLISNEQIDRWIEQLTTVIETSRHAVPTDFSNPHQDPETTYPGVIGYSRGLMTAIAITLQNHRELAEKS
tara:strand:+ start:245 stop:469 length:225 start_codon:yes stop_codon:yes gene_type:complete